MTSSPLRRPLLLLILFIVGAFLLARLFMVSWAWSNAPDVVHAFLERYWLFSSILSGTILILAALGAAWYMARLRRYEREQARAQRLAEIGLLSGGLAHEIRNPLNAMRAHIGLLRRKVASGDQEAAMRKVNQLETATQHLEQLLTDFLSYARPVADHLEEMAPGPLIHQALDFVELDLEQAGVEVVREIPEALPPVYIDADKLKRSLLNLFINARQAMPQGGTLTIRAKPLESSKVLIEVCDTGEGIPLESQPRIFETFFSTKREGTGLGLAVVKRTVEDLGGTIRFRSEPGVGTTFQIELPTSHRRRAILQRQSAAPPSPSSIQRS